MQLCSWFEMIHTCIYICIYLYDWIQLYILTPNKMNVFVLYWNTKLILINYIKMLLVFLSCFSVNHESAQFNIVSELFNIIFKHNLQKLWKTLEFNFSLSISGTKAIVKLWMGTKIFWAILSFVVSFQKIIFEYQNCCYR